MPGYQCSQPGVVDILAFIDGRLIDENTEKSPLDGKLGTLVGV